MALIPICKDCETHIETAMFEIKTQKVQDHPLYIHVDYCPKCDEYKGRNKNFSLEQERDAVIEKFEIMNNNIYGKFIDYKVIMPLKRKS